MPYFAFGPLQGGPAGGRPDCKSTWVEGYVLGVNGLPEPDVLMRVGNFEGWSDTTRTDVNGKYVYQFAEGPIAGHFYVQVYKNSVPSSAPYAWYTSAGCESDYAIQYIRVDWRHW